MVDCRSVVEHLPTALSALWSIHPVSPLDIPSHILKLMKNAALASHAPTKVNQREGLLQSPGSIVNEQTQPRLRAHPPAP